MSGEDPRGLTITRLVEIVSAVIGLAVGIWLLFQ